MNVDEVLHNFDWF